jgi:hypothetical protein
MGFFDPRKITALPGRDPGAYHFFPDAVILDFQNTWEKAQNVISILRLHLGSFAGNFCSV